MLRKLFPVFVLAILMFSIVSGCAPTAAPAAPTSMPAAEDPTAAPVQPTAAPEQPAATTAPTVRAGTPDRLILATTTSTQDSGLLEYLLPDFETEFNTKVDVIAVGTGQALQLGKDGNADVLLVHARAQEDAFMEAGDGTRREDVMYNDFVIVGPESDPAKIKGITSAVDAYKMIAEAGAAGNAIFVSRGDKSGTNTKELAIWKSAEITPEGDWYISAGQGMGEVLTMAAEQEAYTLSDRATYLARTKNDLALQVLVEKDKTLLNPYGVIAVNPSKGPQINTDLATKFIDWIISLPVQEKIEQFGKEDFGQSLFVPDSAAWREKQGGASSGDSTAAGDAALKVTGLVDSEPAWIEEEVKAMDVISVESTNKDGEKSTYDGVLISALLKEAGPKADAKTVVFVADDGFTGEIALADIMACEDCIVSFRSKGGFSTVLPGQPGSLQIKGVVDIQVK